MSQGEYDRRGVQIERALWSWRGSPVPEPVVPVRIGDAERDEAVSSLGDHFAAGRLTREELDERIDQAMAARFNRDLEPLFTDLPKPAAAAAGPRPEPVWPGFLPLFWLAPLLIVGAVVAAVALSAPWVVWVLFWVLLFSGMGRRRLRAVRYQERRPGPWR